MQQVKIFKSIESELFDLETSINTWIQESGARVISITGNIASQTPNNSGMVTSFSASDVLVIVLYEK